MTESPRLQRTSETDGTPVKLTPLGKGTVGNSAAYLRSNVNERLRNLGVERLDLLQLHTWTRAWNDDPQPLLVLRQLREQGKINLIGVSTPEHDQDCVVQLMRDGLVDVVQVIFNLFEQHPL